MSETSEAIFGLAAIAAIIGYVVVVILYENYKIKRFLRKNRIGSINEENGK